MRFVETMAATLFLQRNAMQIESYRAFLVQCEFGQSVNNLLRVAPGALFYGLARRKALRPVKTFRSRIVPQIVEPSMGTFTRDPYLSPVSSYGGLI